MRRYPILAPFTLLTLLLQLPVALLYKPSRIRWRAGCFELVDSTPESRDTDIIGHPGGQSWGARVIWYNMTRFIENRIIPVHERVHIWHAELVNAAAHAVLIPIAELYLGGGWWTVSAVLLAQAAFGISYGVHFMWEWGKLGFKRSRWREAYLKIWTERIAYQTDDEYERGLRPNAWGA